MQDITNRLDHLATHRIPLEQVSEQLKFCRDTGVAQADVVRYLEQLSARAPHEEQEDWIREIMDIAAGWCQPCYKVW